MECKKKLKKVDVDARDLLELIHWARRYADMRCTWVPGDFNKIYDKIIIKNPWITDLEFVDKYLTENGRYFPYAVHGNFKEINDEIQSRCF